MSEATEKPVTVHIELTEDELFVLDAALRNVKYRHALNIHGFSFTEREFWEAWKSAGPKVVRGLRAMVQVGTVARPAAPSGE